MEIVHNTYDEIKTNLKPDIAEARRFLAFLAGSNDDEHFTFQTADDLKTRKSRSLRRVLHGTLEQRADDIEKLNARGAAVWVCVNRTDGRGREKTNIIRAPRALFVDLDTDGRTKLDVVLSCKRRPDAVIESSPGKFHCYWLNDGSVPLNQFEALLTKLAKKFGGDTQVANINQVMRLPGFWHLKDPTKPFMSRIAFISEGGENHGW